ncbi:MAG TPA: class I SAM-dependent methyltransferase, partial [Caldilinea sp.]|nr:class I SAM-dependent methyltransferase [Caldilinea sp.]
TGGRTVDLCFIDGDHSYAGCKADLMNWLPHVREGGIVAFHDCGAPQCEGVERAINEWYAAAAGQNWRELPRAGTIRSFKHVPPVNVLIPTYKRASIVQRTVDLILSNLRHLGQVTIFVGDDSGDGETKAALRGYPSTMVIDAPRRGLGANLNQLLRLASDTSDLVVQLDDDHHLIAPLDLTPHVDKLIREPLAGWIHLMMNAQLNEHWDVSDFHLRGDDLRHWRIMPDSPCKFLASNQPHIKHQRAHHFYGNYPEREKTWQQETEFNEHVQRTHREKPDTSPRFFVPVEAYGFRYWRHVGDSYVQRGM